MSPTVLSIILAIPFIITVGVTGAIFFVSGYKKGPWRALFSLGLTVVATVISLLLSRLLSGILAGPVMGLLPMDSAEQQSAFMDSLTQSVVEGIIQVVLSLVLFFLVLLTLLIVFKCVGNRLKWAEKLDAWDKEKKSLRFAGMGIRALDTLVVTLMLLVPFYGVLASAVAPVSQVQQLSKEEGEEGGTLSNYMESIANHPLLGLYKGGPAAWVMGELSKMDVIGVDVSISDIGFDIEGLVVRYERFNNTSGAERYAALEDLNQYTRDKFVNKTWVYNLICACKDEMNNQLELVDDPEVKTQAKELISLLDMTQAEFSGNATAVLDFITYALNNNFKEFYDTSDYSLLSQKFYTELGELLNYSDQARALKKYFLLQAASSMYSEYYCVDADRYYDSPDYDALVKKAEQKAQALIKNHFKDGKVAKKDWAKEGEAFMMILFEGDCTTLMEAFARHPLFGADTIADLVGPELLLLFDDHLSFDEEQAAEIDRILESLRTDTTVTDALMAKLQSCSTTKMGGNTFGDYVRCAAIVTFDQSDFQFYYSDIPCDCETLDFLINGIGKEYLLKSPAVGEHIYKMLEVLFEYAKDFETEEPYSGSLRLNFLNRLFDMAEDPTLWPTKTYDRDELNSGYYDDGYGDEFDYENPDEYDREYAQKRAFSRLYDILESLSSCKDSTTAFEKLVAQNGKDPFKLGANLSAEQKACLRDILEMIRVWNYIDPSTAGSMLNQDTTSGHGNSYTGSIVVQGGKGDSASLIGGVSNDYYISFQPDGSISATGKPQGGYMTEEEALANNAAYSKFKDVVTDFFGA